METDILDGCCLPAMRRRLAEDGLLPEPEPSIRKVTDVDSRRVAARALDQLRREIGPIHVPVRDLIDEGRRR